MQYYCRTPKLISFRINQESSTHYFLVKYYMKLLKTKIYDIHSVLDYEESTFPTALIFFFPIHKQFTGRGLNCHFISLLSFLLLFK